MHNNEGKTLYPLTHPQKRVWYIEKINPGTSVYNIGGFIRVKGMIRFDLVEEAVNILIRKNEGLRLRITESSGEAMQYVSEYERHKLDFFDFSSLENPEEAFDKWILEESHRVFSFEDSPLYYFATFKLSENECGAYGKVHHIISDGWSFNITLEQICEIYDKLLAGEPVNDEIENSYIEYIAEEQSYLASERFQKNRSFWLEKFDTLPENILPDTSSSLEGRRKTFRVDVYESAEIRKFVECHKISLNTFFLAAFLIYLSKVSQQEDIAIGTPVLNRANRKERSIYGMFTSTMPFRLNMSGNLRASELMKQINSELKSCYFNQKYPYDLLAKDLELKKKGYDGLFQVCVNYYNTKMNKQIGGFTAESFEVYNGYQSYSLQLIIRDWSDSAGIALDLDYKVNDYNEAQIDKIYSYIERAAGQIIKNPEQTIESLEILDEKEKKLLLYELNSTKTEYPRDKTVYRLFEEQTERTPDRTAISFEDKSLTYKELNHKANQLAAFLRSKGVGPDKIVGLMVHHSLEMVIAILGVIKAGGAYLPIDPEYPEDRISYMLEDSHTALILTNSPKTKERKLSGEIIDLTDENIYTGSGENLPPINGMQDLVTNLAYIIYTSGSTGKPKGVMIEHRGLTNYIWWARKMYMPNEGEAFALYSSLSFDLTVTSIFTPLICGNSIVVYRDDGEEFVLYRIMRENKANVIKLTPAHMSLIKDQDNTSSSVKRFIVGGEDLKASLAESIHKSFGGKIEIFNEYGPTETVVGCMIHKYDFAQDKAASVPIGVPSDNVQIYLLDKNLAPVPMGSIGELYIGGDGVARGYLNRPELSAERFLDNPFAPGRMYKTGDLARHLPDGKIEYAGRIDHQVKIRGFRIELGEIERQLLLFEGITDAVVIDRQDSAGSKYLCAYFTALRAIEPIELKLYLSGFLPSYMVPLHYVSMDSIPLTPNGKVDRRLLPEPEAGRSMQAEYASSTNEKEEELIAAMEQVLSIEKIGIHDDFFNLGGDSIKAIQISSRLNEKGYRIKVKDILSHSVVTEMAACMEVNDSNLLADQGTAEGTIENTPIISWFFSQGFPNPHHWNQSVLLELEDSITVEFLEGALSEIIRHHDTLRLNYNADSGKLFYNNKYLDEGFHIETHDLSQLPEAEQNARLKELGKQLKAGMNIENTLPVKGCIFDLGQRGRRFLLTAHHLVIDGVSWRIVLEDLTSLLEKARSNAPAVLPQKTHAFGLWASRLAELGASEALGEKSYWAEVSDCRFSLPVDYDLGEDTLRHSAMVEAQLTEDETGKLLSETNIAYNTDINDLLSIALAQTAKTFSGEKAVVIEMEGHGREELFEDIDISRTVGWFTSMYPVKLDVDSDDLDRQIKALKEQLRRIPSKGIGYGILRYLSNAIDGGGNTQIRFNYLGDFDNTFRGSLFSPAVEKSGSDWDSDSRLTALVDIIAMITDKRLRLSVTYSRNKYREETMKGFLESYVNNIRALIRHCCGKADIEFTPSDFDTVDLSQGDLDELFL